MTEKSATQKRIERIWQTIGDIPQGKVASYGQVAAIAGIPRGARQAAYALRHLPRGHTLPWHRVITSSGRIAFKAGTRPYKEQVKRLKMEDVTVKGGRVDMRIFRWQPDLDELLWKPSAKWDESRDEC